MTMVPASGSRCPTRFITPPTHGRVSGSQWRYRLRLPPTPVAIYHVAITLAALSLIPGKKHLLNPQGAYRRSKCDTQILASARKQREHEFYKYKRTLGRIMSKLIFVLGMKMFNERTLI